MRTVVITNHVIICCCLFIRIVVYREEKRRKAKNNEGKRVGLFAFFAVNKFYLHPILSFFFPLNRDYTKYRITI